MTPRIYFEAHHTFPGIPQISTICWCIKWFTGVAAAHSADSQLSSEGEGHSHVTASSDVNTSDGNSKTAIGSACKWCWPKYGTRGAREVLDIAISTADTAASEIIGECLAGCHVPEGLGRSDEGHIPTTKSMGKFFLRRKTRNIAHNKKPGGQA